MEGKKYVLAFLGLTVLFLLAYYVPYLYFSNPDMEDNIKYEEDAYSENPILWESGNSKYASVTNDDILVETSKIEYEYFLILEDNHISVYKNDKECLYFKTSIRKDTLTDEEIVQLTEGVNILDIDELYNFLESHTS